LVRSAALRASEARRADSGHSLQSARMAVMQTGKPCRIAQKNLAMTVYPVTWGISVKGCYK
jgi:hypothetical protein